MRKIARMPVKKSQRLYQAVMRATKMTRTIEIRPAAAVAGISRSSAASKLR
jgi:hypothetical protein